MGNIIKQILSNASTRILVLVFFFFIAITSYFLISGYYQQLALYEQGELDKLKGISSTLAVQLDGTAHDILYKQFKGKDDLTNTHQNEVYLHFHNILKHAQKANKLETAIYTLVWSPNRKVFDFVVFSDTIYWRHEWKKYHDTHVTEYKTGGVIPPYVDENGTWLSSFSPIKDNHGKVVAIVQADARFDTFINKAWNEIIIRSIISLAIVILVALFLYRSVGSILKKEQGLMTEIKESHSIIEQKNKDITDSILYAKRIQEAILPPIENIRKSLVDSFIVFLPRDIVSGDFYWYYESDDRVFIAAVDCTGHGVPGALMSMIGNTLLSEIIKAKGVTDPGKILDDLEAGIKQAFISREGVSESRDGMDLALVSVCKHFKNIEFAGAFRPLLQVRGDDLTEVKADRFPIGGGSGFNKTNFTTTKLDVQSGDMFYIFSDGYPDQIGGDGSKKLMTKRFKQLVIDNRAMSMDQQGKELRKYLAKWQGVHEQMDDILVIGLRIP
ncbi:MAG: PP2C family protein-serine/threonine phosphatase [Flavobacteriales bacterium]